MKTVKLEYTVENIQNVFRHFAQCNRIPSRPSCKLSIQADGVTIVENETRPEAFVNLFYCDYSECDQLTVTIREYYGKDSARYIFDMTEARRKRELSAEVNSLRSDLESAEDDNETLRRENEKLLDENERLQILLRKKSDKEGFEKITGMKAIDTGDCVVYFIPKLPVAQALSDLLESMKKNFGANPLPFQVKKD